MNTKITTNGITFKDIPWTLQPAVRAEDYDGELLMAIGTEGLREYVVDLREDCRTLRALLADTIAALARVTLERDVLQAQKRLDTIRARRAHRRRTGDRA